MYIVQVKPLKTIFLFLFSFQILSATNILYFNQDCNVDLAGGDNTCADERFTLHNILNAKGHSLTPLPSFSDPNFSSLLSSNDFLVIPDLEESACSGSNLAFMPASASTILNNYVSNGGVILIAGSSNNIYFLNSVFGLTLTTGGFTITGTSTKNGTSTVGTQFETCPSSVMNLSSIPSVRLQD